MIEIINKGNENEDGRSGVKNNKSMRIIELLENL
jgi:hypothetical protein